MRVKELLRQYDFHDSLVKSVREQDGDVTLCIDLCAWRQTDYHEGEDESKEITLLLQDCDDLKFEVVKDGQILSFKSRDREDGAGEFVEMFIDGGDDVKAITFHTRNVDIIL